MRYPTVSSCSTSIAVSVVAAERRCLKAFIGLNHPSSISLITSTLLFLSVHAIQINNLKFFLLLTIALSNLTYSPILLRPSVRNSCTSSELPLRTSTLPAGMSASILKNHDFITEFSRPLSSLIPCRPATTAGPYISATLRWQASSIFPVTRQGECFNHCFGFYHSF